VTKFYEGYLGAIRHISDIGLIDGGVDLHAGEVICDRKERRRLQTRSNSLADGHVSRDHNAVYRRINVRIPEVDSCLLQLRLSPRELRPGLIEIRRGSSLLRLSLLDPGLSLTVLCPGRIRVRFRPVGSGGISAADYANYSDGRATSSYER